MRSGIRPTLEERGQRGNTIELDHQYYVRFANASKSLPTTIPDAAKFWGVTLY